MPEELQKRLEHPCFPQPVDGNNYVWRYMPLAKLISLLQSRSIYLSRLDILKDKHEGSLTHLAVMDRSLGANNFSPEKTLAKTREFNRQVKNACYVNCWSQSPIESEAFWRLYTSKDDGIAIKTSYQSLLDIVKPVDGLYIGKISYLDYEVENFPLDNIFYQVMHKRLAFAHENEVRIIKLEDRYMLPESGPGPIGLHVPVNLESLIQLILISPYVQHWYVQVVEEVLHKFAPKLGSRVMQSRMNHEPRY